MPRIVKREYALGNEIGNHTFTHPEFEADRLSKTELQVQLNLTELLLESYLGVKTTLFRPPYGIDHQPETASEIQMLPIPQSMGYVIIGARIDPHDWGENNGQPPAPADTIVQRVLAQTETNDGNIILLHDGGGDRSHTVAALPQIIEGLRAKGYEFVSVSDLLGQTRAQVMPSLTYREWLLVRADAFIFEVFRWLRSGIAFIFIAGILLVGGRALIIGLLALAEKLRPDAAGSSGIPAGGQRADPRLQRRSGDRRYGSRGARFQLSEAGNPRGGRWLRRSHRRTCPRELWPRPPRAAAAANQSWQALRAESMRSAKPSAKSSFRLTRIPSSIPRRFRGSSATSPIPTWER